MVDVIKGKYKLVREIARSNDIVYEATDTTFGRRIALKELNIPANLTGQAHRERVERFHREARAAGRLSHPNIVSIFDFGEENGRHFIAMEYLEGQTLRDAMQVRGAFPLRDALNIASQILDALAFAHQNHVIHRDIKPDNIHILPGGQVKLTDFGIARLSEEPALTSNGQVFGTPSYMSPEQIEGRNIDHRSDLFSLGVLLYEMLAGRKPFVGDSVISITYAIMNAEAPPLASVPSGIEQVIRRALSKNPNDRQSTAEQFKLDLKAAESTPAIFLSTSPRTNMGSPGVGPMGYSTMPPMSPGNAMSTGLPGIAQPGSMMGGSLGLPQMAPPASHPPGPWAWNPASAQGGNANSAPNLPLPPGVLPRAPSAPLFVLSPGAKTVLISVGAAAVLGAFVAMGVIAFLGSYDHYKVAAGAARIGALEARGTEEYANRDYDLASKDFEQALTASPAPDQRARIQFDLAASYIRLAQTAVAGAQWSVARDLYLKALTVAPDRLAGEAHAGLAAVLDRLGDADGAREHRNAAPPDGSAPVLPATLDPKALPPDTYYAPKGANTPDHYIDDRRALARQHLAEGDQLKDQGDIEGARAKWNLAVSDAPATPERDDAVQRLSSYPSPSNSSGQ